jgi:hypothetical protein
MNQLLRIESRAAVPPRKPKAVFRPRFARVSITRRVRFLLSHDSETDSNRFRFSQLSIRLKPGVNQKRIQVAGN